MSGLRGEGKRRRGIRGVKKGNRRGLGEGQRGVGVRGGGGSLRWVKVGVKMVG